MKAYKSIDTEVIRAMNQLAETRQKFKSLRIPQNRVPELVVANALVHQTAMRMKAEFERDHRGVNVSNLGMRYWHALAQDQLLSLDGI